MAVVGIGSPAGPYVSIAVLIQGQVTVDEYGRTLRGIHGSITVTGSGPLHLRAYVEVSLGRAPRDTPIAIDLTKLRLKPTSNSRTSERSG